MRALESVFRAHSHHDGHRGRAPHRRFSPVLARCLACAAMTLLGACSEPMRALSNGYSFLRQNSDSQIERTVPAKGHQYLKVSLLGRSALLVLGNVEQNAAGPVEVWYSGAGEVLRIQGGRLIGATGLSTEWLNVRLSAPPDWLSIEEPMSYARRRDVMPAYDFGEVDVVTVTPIDMPVNTHYTGPKVPGLRWFAERTRGRIALRDSRYGVAQRDGHAVVVYGEQCLDERLCLSWQRWPAEV
ncbi:YjbF family lipoprotein [Caballeronia mineralivorans]|nr:YjbF family lipoprotein [Caballeronia mineralivorans]